MTRCRTSGWSRGTTRSRFGAFSRRSSESDDFAISRHVKGDGGAETVLKDGGGGGTIKAGQNDVVMTALLDDIGILLRRDLEGLQREISWFPDDRLLWATTGGVTNSAGNLALHVAGNLQH